MVSGWQEVYGAEHERLLLGRLRWCAALALLGAAFLGAQNLLQGGPWMLPRLGFALAYAVASLLAWTSSCWTALRRRPVALAVGYVVALIAIMAHNYAELPADAGLAPAGFVALTVGVTVLLPWGARSQAIVGGATLVGYAWVLAHAPQPLVPGALGLVLSMVVVAVVAAELIERYRASSVKRAWQQEQLLSLARGLAAQLDLTEVIGKVLEHGLRLVEADSVALTLRDATRRLYRMEAVAGSPVQAGSWLGVEVPEDHPAVRAIADRGTMVLPEDDPESPLLSLLAEHHVRHILYEVLRYGDEAIGVLSFVRRADARFDPGDRLLSRGIADQAALAIRTSRLVAELRQANRFKSEFVSTMSHELRTPLNVIMGYGEMIQDEGLGQTAREHAAVRIIVAAQQLTELIENTLEVGKVDAGRGEPHLETVYLPAFWSELGRACGEMLHTRQVPLEWQTRDVPETSLRTDPRKLTIAIRNLVSNALKFTEAGFVRAEVSAEADELIFRVSDTGIGIRPEDHDAIFEMFRQADQSNTRRYGGTGLGLYLVRRFAEQLGGRVTLQSAVGRGSVFTIRLPGRAPAPLRAVA
jgi:signal transduction histidine kinase